MADQRITSFHSDAEKAIHFLQGEYGKLQTGRANASLIEHIDVDAYGQKMNMKSVAGISIQDARTIVIQPWDRGVLASIEKAIQISNIGVNPVNDGTVIRLNLPAMTEERRMELKKLVHKLAEDARISIRQVRQKAQDSIKQEPNETLKNSLTAELQKEVDKANERIDEIRTHKEEEVMKI
ncbi:MAG TPA: ribosome recycling factor [Candidatus Peribacteraceae bacterium]|nr:ribosome recycling factor [Candidatus Peribacteraceae bacterium]